MSFGLANLLDLDIYSRRISFFYRGKEKITSRFGFFLTILYIIISISIFLYYFFRTISREDVTASDSNIFTDDIPSIKINTEIFNLAFGLERPTGISRFIDETIYYPEAYYIENITQDAKNNISALLIQEGEFNQITEGLTIYVKRHLKIFVFEF